MARKRRAVANTSSGSTFHPASARSMQAMTSRLMLR